MTENYHLILQSHTTGRILLRKTKDVWGFAVQTTWDPDVGMLFKSLRKANATMGLAYDNDEFCVEYIGEYHGQVFFHLIVDGEPLAAGEDAEWHALFDFPEPFDSNTNPLFEGEVFLEKIVAPTY